MNPLVDRAIAQQENALRVPLPYLRTIADHSLSAFVKFGLFAPLAQHRKVVPAAPWHLARLAATRAEDCGTCVQVVVNVARNEGVPAETLRTALDDPDALTGDERLGLDFGAAVAENGGGLDALREQVRERFGEEGLVELSLAVATAQVFPVVKRGLGLAQACALVQVEVD